MKIRLAAIMLAMGVVLTAVALSAATADSACAIGLPLGSSWVATGTVTKMDGSLLYFLGKDNLVYKIDTEPQDLVFVGLEGGRSVLRAGEKIRIYGVVEEGCQIRAKRIRIYDKESGEPEALPRSTAADQAAGPQKEIRIIVENAPQPIEQAPVTAYAPPPLGTWDARGLVIDIDYTARKLKVQTTSGQYTVALGNAAITSGSRMIGLGLLNLGDAVRINGSLVGLNEVSASRVNVTRTFSEAQNAVPQLPVSVSGVVQQVDYASFTFRMGVTGGAAIVVLADTDTVVQFQMHRWAFMDLKPGMRIKMSGYGSPGTGYSAQHIQVISLSP